MIQGIPQAIRISAEAMLDIDIAPLSPVWLSFNGIWRLQALETDRGG
ncbi:hypothetical protein U5A82_09065 [Sphingobium sp. CR2-8]|nr:hypothetical protein [Sphingobium sp. CR2-8]MEC3910624.1 hypothetical protein [Sphingobium sp. CR2-8]